VALVFIPVDLVERKRETLGTMKLEWNFAGIACMRLILKMNILMGTMMMSRTKIVQIAKLRGKYDCYHS
jgi:hypothetical protein